MKITNNSTTVGVKYEEKITATTGLAAIIILFGTSLLAWYAWNNIITEMFSGKHVNYIDAVVLVFTYRLITRSK